MLYSVLRLLSAVRSAVTPARWKACLAHALAILLWSIGGFAASSHAQVLQGAVDKAVVQTPQLHAELMAHAPQGVQTGQPVWVGLALTHQPEWHTYWRNPGDSGLPTQIELNLPTGITAGEVQWPLPHKLKAGNLTNYGFEKTVLLAVPLTVTQAFKANASQTLDLQVHANWLVCRLECIPQEGDFALRIPVNSSYAPHAAAFETLQAQQPQPLPSAKVTASFEAQRLVLQVSGLPASLHGQKLGIFPNTPELVESAAEQHPAAHQSWQDSVWMVQLPLSNLRLSEPKQIGFLLTADMGTVRQGFEVFAPITQTWPSVSDLPVVTAPVVTPPASDEGILGFVLALLGALAGGLILNLMPCVLPVLAIKLLGFAQHSRAHRAHRVAGMAYTAGVVLSFLALGAGVLALRAAGEQLGWGFQLQSPTVVSVLAVLFTLIALNLFGLFEFGHILPSQVTSFQSKHPVMDAALSGILAVAVASPCTAPFMGASLGLAMTLPTWQALSIFAAMGLGLAAPYLLASFVPAVARLMPRPGSWMVTLRQLLAFPMLATVLWLLWVLGQQTSLDAAMFALGGLLLLATIIWALRQNTPAARGLAWLLAMAWIWGAVNFADELKTSNHPTSNSTLTAPLQANAQAIWQPWSEAAVAHSLDLGRPVFVDFTAAWCVTCQINKKSTLSHPDVLAAFAEHHVTLLRADWTRRDPAISAALTTLGRSGVPVYVLHAPGKAPQILSELLSVNKVREALANLPASDHVAPTTDFAQPVQTSPSATLTRQ